MQNSTGLGVVCKDASGNALDPAGNTVTVAAGATLQLLGTGLNVNQTTNQGTYPVLILNGSGVNGAGALVNLTGGNNTYSGQVYLASDATVAANVGTTLSLAGIVSGPGSLTVGNSGVGSGIVALNGANSYAGNTTVNDGILQVGNSLALGLPVAPVSVAAGATLQLTGSNMTVAGKNLTMTGAGYGFSGGMPLGALQNNASTNTWSGNIALAGTLGLTSGTIPLFAASNTGAVFGALTATTLNVTGVVSGSDLAKTGAGAVTLLNVNTYTGQTAVLAGTLTLSNTNAATGTATVSGAAVNSAFTAGQITLNMYGTLSASSLAIGQGGTVLLDNTANNIVSTGVAGSGRLNNATAQPAIAMNSGTLTYLAFNAPGAISTESLGAVSLQSGVSIINGGYSGAATTVASTSLVESGNTVTFTAASIPASYQVGQTVNITAAVPADFCGTFIITAVTATTFTVTNPTSGLGTATTQATAAVVAVQQTGATSTLNLAGLTRSTGATLSINASPNTTTLYQQLNQTSNQILIPTASFPTAALYLGSNGGSTGGILGNGNSYILPYAQVGAGAANSNFNWGDFAATYVSGATTGLMALPATGYYYASTLALLQAAPTNALVDLFQTAAAGGIVTTAGQTIGALRMDGYANNGNTASGGFNLTLAGTWNIASGSIMSVGGTSNGTTTRNIIKGGSLNLSGESFLFQNFCGGADWTELDSALVGTGSLVVSGEGRLYMNCGTNVNTFTGGLVVNNAQQVLPGNSGMLGAGTVTMVAGGLSDNTANAVFSNPFIFNGYFAIGGNGNGNAVVLDGPVTINGNAFINMTGTTGYINGVVSGTGTLTVTSGGNYLYLNNANTFSGGVFVDGAGIMLGNSAGLGTGPLTLIGGTLSSNVSVVLNNNLNLVNAGTTIINSSAGQGQNMTFVGTTTLTGNNTLTITTGGTLNFAGQVTGKGDLILSGFSQLGAVELSNTSLANPNDFAGGLTISAGQLILAGPNVLGSGTFTLNGGSVFANTAAAGQIANPYVINASTILSGESPFNFSNTGTVVANATLTVNDWAGVTVAGSITSAAAAALTIAGTGTLTLANANAFTGGLTMNMSNTGADTGTLGTLVIPSGAALGGAALILNIGVLDATAPVAITNASVFDNTASNPIVLAGSAMAFNNTVALSGSGAFEVSVSNTTTINGVISGGHSFAMIGQPMVATTTSGLSTTYLGTGNLIITATMTDAGALSAQIGAGTLTLSGNGTLGAMTNGLIIGKNAAVVLDNTSTVLATRLPSTMPIIINGGSLVIEGNANATMPLTQTLGTLTVIGNATITSVNNGAAVSTTFASWARDAGGTVNFVGQGATLGSAGNQILFTAALPAATVSNGVMVGATTTDGTLITGAISNTSGFNLAAYGNSGVAAYGTGANGVGTYTARADHRRRHRHGHLHRHQLDGPGR